MKLRLVFLALLGAVLFAPLSAHAQLAPCPQNEVFGVFQLTNAYRAMYRQPPVVWSNILGNVAAGHAWWMAGANTLSHIDAYGLRVRDRVTRAGYGEFITTVAENVAMGQGNAEGVIEAWKRSPTHNMALLLPDIQEIGVACVMSQQRKPFWVLVVAAKLGLPH